MKAAAPTKAAEPAETQPLRGAGAPLETTPEATLQRAGGKHADFGGPEVRKADPPAPGGSSWQAEQAPGGSLLPRSRRAARHKLIEVEKEADVPRERTAPRELAASPGDGVESVERVQGRADARRGA